MVDCRSAGLAGWCRTRSGTAPTSRRDMAAIGVLAADYKLDVDPTSVSRLVQALPVGTTL